MMQRSGAAFFLPFTVSDLRNHTSGATLSFGQFGLKAMAPGPPTGQALTGAGRALTRHMKRAGRVWIRIFPDVPVSKKPAEAFVRAARFAGDVGLAPGRAGRDTR